MKTATINKHKITYYSGIEDTPIGRYNIFQQNLLYDASVGNSIESIMERFEGLDANLSAGKLKEARIERNNLQITFFSILNQVNFAARAMVCLITEIDGKPMNDLSEGGIETVLEKLKEIKVSIGDIQDLVFGQKKNLKTVSSITSQNDSLIQAACNIMGN